ncbi:hypothetical protein QK414_34770 [Pseudomonas aeruginosa]|nr:hypothetical protein [Pseudomonas aeruginosa]MDI4056616.1 hypothetical protein [Pseudomonas aeruginosa]MDI4168114.1 hypothetical protein [Pseudomonas aeruginosa]
MRNEIKAILAATMMITAFSANAAFRVQIPLEIDGGGHLPNGSIVFTGENEIEPVDKAKECDDNISNTLNYLSSNYSDVNYISGGLANVRIRVGVDFIYVERCSVSLSTPRSKTSACVGNDEYVQGISTAVAAFGVNSIQIGYYGVCD